MSVCWMKTSVEVFIRGWVRMLLRVGSNLYLEVEENSFLRLAEYLGHSRKMCATASCFFPQARHKLLELFLMKKIACVLKVYLFGAL